MRVWTIAIVAGLLFGCATGTANRLAELDVAGRVLARVLDLADDPTVTSETCKSDSALLLDLAAVIADRIDGGEATGSDAWKTVDGFRELLVTLGCPFVPDLSMYHPERPMPRPDRPPNPAQVVAHSPGSSLAVGSFRSEAAHRRQRCSPCEPRRD